HRILVRLFDLFDDRIVLRAGRALEIAVFDQHDAAAALAVSMAARVGRRLLGGFGEIQEPGNCQYDADNDQYDSIVHKTPLFLTPIIAWRSIKHVWFCRCDDEGGDTIRLCS